MAAALACGSGEPAAVETPASGGTLIIRLLDLGANGAGGGGDAILVSDSSAGGVVHGLIDAGPAGEGAGDPGYVAARLVSLGVDTLAFLLLTHAHADHYEGIPAVLNVIRARRFIYNGQLRNYSGYTNAINLARLRSDSTIVPRGSVYSLPLRADTPTTWFNVIPPLPDYLEFPTDSSSQLNDGSLGAELRLGPFRMFFAADGEVRANHRWRAQFPGYTGNVTVLKAGHHGANDAVFDNGSSGLSAWLAHTDPEVVVISANGTSHPRGRALTAFLDQASRRTHCTNTHGTIEIRVTATGTFTVVVAKNSGRDCVKGSEATT